MTIAVDWAVKHQTKQTMRKPDFVSIANMSFNAFGEIKILAKNSQIYSTQ